MTKKSHQKFWRMKIEKFFWKRYNFENFQQSLNIFRKYGGNLKQGGGNASWPQRGMDAPVPGHRSLHSTEQGVLIVPLACTSNKQSCAFSLVDLLIGTRERSCNYR